MNNELTKRSKDETTSLLLWVKFFLAFWTGLFAVIDALVTHILLALEVYLCSSMIIESNENKFSLQRIALTMRR